MDALSSGRARELGLDALRGLAVLGGLAVNIRAFASIDAARVNPTTWGDLSGLNWWIWAATYVLGDGKFVSMFALVFGAGVAARTAQRAGGGAGTHYRRMAALAVLGALHAYLVWWGDWLLILSVAGAAVYHYREAKPRQLIATGLALYAVYSVLAVGLTISLPWWPPETAQGLHRAWVPSPIDVQAEIAAYRGGWADQQPLRIRRAFAYQSSELALRFIWQLSGLMLLGMGLYKLGWLTPTARPSRYALMAGLGMGIGLPTSIYEIHRSFQHGWDLIDYRLVVAPLAYWSSLAITLGWAGLVLLGCRLGLRMVSLAAIGRLALSNYLLQTAVCSVVFYGHGLGLFARIERSGQLALVVVLWGVEIIASRLWLMTFEMGPIESVWRGIAALRLPLRSLR
jgi:uncharacterized protein